MCPMCITAEYEGEGNCIKIVHTPHSQMSRSAATKSKSHFTFSPLTLARERQHSGVLTSTQCFLHPVVIFNYLLQSRGTKWNAHALNDALVPGCLLLMSNVNIILNINFISDLIRKEDCIWKYFGCCNNEGNGPADLIIFWTFAWISVRETLRPKWGGQGRRFCEIHMLYLQV